MLKPISRDVTHLVSFSDNDGESLPLTRCVCGKEFAAWDFILSIYPDMARECPACGRKLYFDYSITVYEIETPVTEYQRDELELSAREAHITRLRHNAEIEDASTRG